MGKIRRSPRCNTIIRALISNSDRNLSQNCKLVNRSIHINRNAQPSKRERRALLCVMMTRLVSEEKELRSPAKPSGGVPAGMSAFRAYLFARPPAPSRAYPAVMKSRMRSNSGSPAMVWALTNSCQEMFRPAALSRLICSRVTANGTIGS